MLARMKSATSLLCFVMVMALSGCRTSQPNAVAQEAQPGAEQAITATGTFDYYLLNLSWSPEFCHSHPDATECAAHARFVLHGLWPQNNDGSYPERCSNAPGPANAAAYKDIYADAGLLQHEWKAHGTCSGLSAEAFFAQARAAVRAVKIPAELDGLDRQTSMTPEEILGLFAQSNPAIGRTGMALSCGNNYLTAIEVCLDKSLHPMACPSTLRSCRARTVKIAAP
jgi:ribonuclease T2